MDREGCGGVTLPFLVLASQLADGLAYQLVHGTGTELNPAAALLIAAFGPLAILGIKVAGGLVLGIGAAALGDRRRTALTWMATVGFAGCLTELVAIA